MWRSQSAFPPISPTGNSERYQSFIERCNLCRNQLKQTELSFLSPPSQRSQCRYFNVERLIDWSQKIWNSSIDLIASLIPNVETKVLNQKLNDKFGWLIDYQEEIQLWSQMVKMTRTLETYLKISGINQQYFQFLQSCLNFNVNPNF